MKNIITLILLLFVISQMKAQTYIDKKGRQQLWGGLSISDLQEGPYKEWYEKNYHELESNLNALDGKKLKDVRVKIFLGTWCGDTKYLVPKFIHAWKKMQLSEDQLELIAVHHEDNNYKQGPNQETEAYNIHRVPTMIFERKGKEIGRIVERTVFDLDTDIKQIAHEQAYQARYPAIPILVDFMQSTAVDSLLNKTSINQAYRKVRREVSSASELNAFAYVLKAQNQLQKAEFVFLLNTYLFKYHPNVHDSYGEILMEQKKYKEAALEYYEVIRLKKEDSNAVSQLAKIDLAVKVAKDVK